MVRSDSPAVYEGYWSINKSDLSRMCRSSQVIVSQFYNIVLIKFNVRMRISEYVYKFYPLFIDENCLVSKLGIRVHAISLHKFEVFSVLTETI